MIDISTVYMGIKGDFVVVSARMGMEVLIRISMGGLMISEAVLKLAPNGEPIA